MTKSHVTLLLWQLKYNISLYEFQYQSLIFFFIQTFSKVLVFVPIISLPPLTDDLNMFLIPIITNHFGFSPSNFLFFKKKSNTSCYCLVRNCLTVLNHSFVVSSLLLAEQITIAQPSSTPCTTLSVDHHIVMAHFHCCKSPSCHHLSTVAMLALTSPSPIMLSSFFQFHALIFPCCIVLPYILFLLCHVIFFFCSISVEIKC